MQTSLCTTNSALATGCLLAIAWITFLNAASNAGAADNTAATAATDQAAKQAWPRFRGPHGNGSSPARDLPETWGPTEHIVWKSPLPGPGASSPITYRDRIYVTCYSGYLIPGQTGGSLSDLKRHLLAIDRENGAIVWDQAIAASLPEEESIRDHGYAASTPVADEAGVIVFFGKTGVVAFDHAGRQVWQADVGQQTNGWGSASSPILHDGIVIINASVESESLVALDRHTGRQLWRAAGIKEAWNTPVVLEAETGRREVVVATHGALRAFAVDSGAPLWTCDTDITWYMAPSLIAEAGVVYSLGGRSGITALAVRGGGNGDVTRTHRLWTAKHGSNVSSPVLADGYLFWMNDQRGIAYCTEAETGEVVYEQRLERAGQVYASPLLAGGRVYYLTRGGKTFVLAATPEFKQLAVNELSDGGQFNGSPAVDGDRLLIRSDKYLYCIGR